MDRMLFSTKGIKPVLAALAASTVLQGFMIIIQAYALADAISSLFRGDLFSSVVKKLAVFFMALMVRQFLIALKKNIAFRFAAKTGENKRKKMVQKLFQLGPRFVSAAGSGQTVTLVQDGFIKFRNYLELFLPKAINMAFIPAMVALFVLFQNVRSGIILIVSLPLLIVFMILLGLAAKSKADRQYQSYQLLSNHFVDSLRGLETLKYLGLSQKHIEKISLVSEKYRQATMETLKIAFLSSFALDFFSMLSIATVAVFLGLDLINGTIGLQTALTILILAPEYFTPIRELGADYHATLDGKEAGRQIQEILELEIPVQDQVPLSPWNRDSHLSVSGLSLQFPDNASPGLEQLQFSISGMKKIGIIGPSGSGKSTLVNILSGFLNPTSGNLDVNGTKLTSLSQVHWQKQITYIPQKPYLFHDTVLNNIRFYHPEATEMEVDAAAAKAGLSEVIQELPEGFQTIIGEGGRTLSGGQEQRIAIARAFLGKRPIIILDEPTAHLDIETESELKETMLRLFQGRLVFFATHRLHWMPNMDQILVLDHGKIVESGTHQQLYSSRGAYYQFVKTQLEDF